MPNPETDVDVIAFLHALNNGHFLEQFFESITSVADAVTETKGSGAKVTIDIPIGILNRDDSSLTFGADIKRSYPKVTGGKKVFYAQEGRIYRQDPRQPELTLRVIDEQTGEIRELPIAEPKLREMES